MERFEGRRDLEARVASQGGIDFLEDESGGIDGKVRGEGGEGLADFGGWEIAALRGDRQNACARVSGGVCDLNGDGTKTVHGEVHGGVAGAGEIVGDEEAVHGGQLSTMRSGRWIAARGSTLPYGRGSDWGVAARGGECFDFGHAGR